MSRAISKEGEWKNSLNLPILRCFMCSSQGMSKEGEWIENLAAVPDSLSRHFTPSMFPPEDAKALGLEKWSVMLDALQSGQGLLIICSAILQRMVGKC